VPAPSEQQSSRLRVPFGDFNCLVLPPDAEKKENDYAMLSDIFPTGYHATVLAGVEPGDRVVIYLSAEAGSPMVLGPRHAVESVLVALLFARKRGSNTPLQGPTDWPQLG
jgi:hypothetical protein